ncbi:MAG: DEAD/DEAH box helicase [Deltaproteobacteria bacterium]|nr:DEAD/DEAH box helicase [Deltaproteobacteria bacterium]
MEKVLVTVHRRMMVEGPLPEAAEAEIRRMFTVDNPAWVAARRFGRYSRHLKRRLVFCRTTKNGMSMPRGAASRVLEVLSRHGVDHVVADKTRRCPETPFSFAGTLMPHQEKAAEAALSRRFGVMALPTGAGKTVVALAVIAARGQPACVVVHTKELMYQWIDRAAAFLGMDPEEVGRVGDGQNRVGDRLTVALIHSLYSRTKQIAPKTGHLVVDECHHVPARTFTHAVSGFDCRYMLGLSATPFRRDGLTPLIHCFVGPRVIEVKPVQLQRDGSILGARVCVRRTAFDYPFREDYGQMMTALCADDARNSVIAADVAAWVEQGRGPALVVSERKSHCRELAARIRAACPRTDVLTGDTPGPARRRAIEKADSGELDVLVATLQLVGEGFDCPGLCALFLATPMKFSGRVLQVVGRILRIAEGKGGAVVFDYVDRPGVLAAAYASRRRVYARLGLSESAPPAFPAKPPACRAD